MSYLSPFLTELWRLVAGVGRAQMTGEYRRDKEIASLCREYHSSVREGLDKLAEHGFLRTSLEGAFQPKYWFSTECRVPMGCQAPGAALPAGTERAGARKHVNAVMPIDTTPLHKPMNGERFEFAKHPSRRGDRLHYRDGRVTDLDGRPIP